MIVCSQLSKEFKSYKRKAGLTGLFTSFFSRQYFSNMAVGDFDLSICPGEIVALLGPNGSGKTTLMKMFTGIIVPTKGNLEVCGHIPLNREKAFRRKIALVMGQKSQLWWDISAMDSFKLLQRYYEIGPFHFKKRLDEFIEYLGVEDILHIHVRKLSLGERMKLELMASLLHRPEIIFLDEPTIGLDIVAQESIRKFICQYHEKYKCTIVLTSHYMADVEALCKRLVLIFNGRKCFDGKLSQFSGILGQKKSVNFSFLEPQNKADAFWQNYKTSWNEQATQVELQVDGQELRDASRKILEDYPVCDFYTEKMPIEKVMKTLMKNPEIIRGIK